jgi:hypothetical protein
MRRPHPDTERSVRPLATGVTSPFCSGRSHDTETPPAPRLYTSAMFSETGYAQNGDLRVAYRASREGPRDIVFVPTWFTCCEHFQHRAQKRSSQG